MKHGTRSMYRNRLCRCDPCKQANRDYQREYQQRPEIRKRTRRPKRVYFTPTLWAIWHDARRPDGHTVTLREGIEELRAALDARDIHHQPLSR